MSILSLISPFAWARRILSLIFILAVAFYVYCGYLVYQGSRLQTNASLMKPARAIVLLGPTGPTAELSGDMIGRLNQVISLYEAHIAPKVIVAGNGPGVSFAKQYLSENKIPMPRMTVVRAGSIPPAMAALINSYGGKSSELIVVADALQATYVENIASSDQLRIVVSPGIGSESISTSGFLQLAKEASAVAVGKIIGFSNVDWG